MARDIPVIDLTPYRTGSAKARVAQAVGDSVHVHKLGLQIFLAGDYYKLIGELVAKGK